MSERRDVLNKARDRMIEERYSDQEHGARILFWHSQARRAEPLLNLQSCFAQLCCFNQGFPLGSGRHRFCAVAGFFCELCEAIFYRDGLLDSAGHREAPHDSAGSARLSVTDRRRDGASDGTNRNLTEPNSHLIRAGLPT